MDNRTAVGVFDDRAAAAEAVRGLRAVGFADSHIGVISRDAGAAADSRTDWEGGTRTGLPGDPTHTRWEEGTGLGAAAGAVTGTGLGLAVAAEPIPGVGPVIAGGALVALLASAGAGATVGTVIGGLVGLGVPEDEAAGYETDFNTGRTLVTVAAGHRYEDAVDVLRKHGAQVRTHAYSA